MMGKEHVAQFFSRIEEDSSLNDQFGAAIEAAIEKAVVDLGRKHGFRFNAKELHDYFDSVQSELSEHDLDGVSAAGGPEGASPGRAASLLSSMIGGRSAGTGSGRVHIDISDTH